MYLVSFGFKHGVPYDADLVFDGRFLPNPHFVEALQPLDGRAAGVGKFVFDQAEGREFLTGSATSWASCCRSTSGRARPI